MMGSRIVWAGVLGVACIGSSPSTCRGGDEPAFEPRAFAATRVFRIDTDVNSGSATLLALEGKKALFATCFHVLSDASIFKLSDINDSPVARSDDGAEVLRRWDRDLVLIRVPVSDTSRLAPEPIVGEGVPVVTGGHQLPGGYAFGYPGRTLDGKPLDLIDVKLRFRNQPIALRTLRSFEEQAYRPTGDDRDLSKFEVRELSDGITYPGMSGGLVIDDCCQFGGLIFGQADYARSLMIPAEAVVETVKQATGERPRKFVRFDRSLFRAPPPFAGSVQDELGILPLRCEATLNRIAELFDQKKFAEMKDLLKGTRVEWEGRVVEANKDFTLPYCVRSDRKESGPLRVWLLLDNRDPDVKFVEKSPGVPIRFEGRVFSFPKTDWDEKEIQLYKCKILP